LTDSENAAFKEKFDISGSFDPYRPAKMPQLKTFSSFPAV